MFEQSERVFQLPLCVRHVALVQLRSYHRQRVILYLSYGSRPVHNDKHSDKRNCAPNQIKPIGRDLIDSPSPQDRENNKQSAVRRVHTPKARWLQGRYDTVKNEHGCSDYGVIKRPIFTQPQPDKVTAADLTQTSGDEVE